MKKLAFSVIAGAFVISSAFTTLHQGAKPAEKKLDWPEIIQAPGKWVLDKTHSNVRFSVTHLVVSDVDGGFKSFDGSMTSAKPDFTVKSFMRILLFTVKRVLHQSCGAISSIS